MTGTYQHQDVNYKALNGWTPLTLAVFHGKLDCVETLVKRLVLQRPKMGLHPYICFKFAWKMYWKKTHLTGQVITIFPVMWLEFWWFISLSSFSLLCDCNFGKYAPFSRKFTWMHKCGRLTGDKWYIMRQWICVFFLAKLSEMAMDIYIYTVHIYIIYIIIYICTCVFAKSFLWDMILMVCITKHMTNGCVYPEHVFFLVREHGNMIKHQILGYCTYFRNHFWGPDGLPERCS